MTAIVLRLPLPPTTNGLFLNNKRPPAPGKKRRPRIRTPVYSAWREQAGYELNLQHIKPIKGPVFLEYDIRDGARGDIDNYAKPIGDLLVTHGVIEADSPKIVRGITLRWAALVEGVEVTIRPAIVMLCSEQGSTI